MSRTAEPREGQHAWFIRYVSTRDGWIPETIRGDIEERTEVGWQVRVGDELRYLPRRVWSFYRP
jgi:hypothetical protein